MPCALAHALRHAFPHCIMPRATQHTHATATTAGTRPAKPRARAVCTGRRLVRRLLVWPHKHQAQQRDPVAAFRFVNPLRIPAVGPVAL